MGHPTIDHTHARALKSWVADANGHASFPIQNLPLCVFSTAQLPPRGGVVIGDHIVDLHGLSESRVLPMAERDLVRVAAASELNQYFSLQAEDRKRLRYSLSAFLSADHEALSSAANVLIAQRDAEFHLPAKIGGFSEFFSGIHHAANCGRVLKPPGEPALNANYKYVPLAYNGRASSIRASGHPVVRPVGQLGSFGTKVPEFGPIQGVDFELEIALWIGGNGNRLGEPVPIGRAGEHIAGFGLLNDWSARDMQFWEQVPNGPFLSKSYLTTVSPFVVTTDALAPFRTAQPIRPEGDPAPLPYLLDADDQAQGAFDIHLEVYISSAQMRERKLAPFRVTRSNALDLYWTPAQMMAHHTSNGCDVGPGDVFGTGTISSATEDGCGCLLERTLAGKRPFTLPSGESRTYLEDGDEVTLTAYCERPGFARIGFGKASGVVTPNPKATSQ